MSFMSAAVLQQFSITLEGWLSSDNLLKCIVCSEMERLTSSATHLIVVHGVMQLQPETVRGTITLHMEIIWTDNFLIRMV